MTYKGTIRNRVVVFDGDIPPEGTTVQVEPVQPITAPVDPCEIRTKTVWEKLLELRGQSPGLPEDAARNHDHYLYGASRK